MDGRVHPDLWLAFSPCELRRYQCGAEPEATYCCCGEPPAGLCVVAGVVCCGCGVFGSSGPARLGGLPGVLVVLVLLVLESFGNCTGPIVGWSLSLSVGSFSPGARNVGGACGADCFASAA